MTSFDRCAYVSKVFWCLYLLAMFYCSLANDINLSDSTKIASKIVKNSAKNSKTIKSKVSEEDANKDAKKLEIDVNIIENSETHRKQQHHKAHHMIRRNTTANQQHLGFHLSKRCGGPNHASLLRPCSKNDTYCGKWVAEDRYWVPSNCFYEDISSSQARKCIGNRTLAFVGDSQIRDLGIGVGLFLSGHLLKTSPDDKFDKSVNLREGTYTTPLDISTWMEKDNHWKNNVACYLMPKPEIAKENGNWPWQVQIFSLYKKQLMRDFLQDIFSHSVVQGNKMLKPASMIFLNYGLHDWDVWNSPPFGEKFYDKFIEQWKDVRSKHMKSTPSSWVSLNPECAEKLTFAHENVTNNQYLMVEETNKYLNSRLLKEKLPYWDIGAPLRTDNRCSISADGLHVKMYVDIMRAKMLFSHLCDANMKWRGDERVFI